MRTSFLKRLIVAALAVVLAITAGPTGRFVTAVTAIETACDEGDCGCPQPMQRDDCRAAGVCVLACAAVPGLHAAVIQIEIGSGVEAVVTPRSMASRAIPPPIPPPLV